ncbi:MAG: hypothetical protein K2N58_02550 [Treponemataceae bacterium]|nr:hypothetical protein [Treponemataceae bacterium]
MNVKLKANSALALALCAVLFCSCGTKEELFESYDSCFVPISSNAASFALTPDTQDLMLRDAYEISLSDDVPSITLALSCPVECDSYDWKITGAQTTDTAALSDTTNNGAYKDGVYKWGTRNIAVYITKSDGCIFYRDAKGSGQPCYYRIHLAVKVGDQDFYDSALLAVRVGSEEGGAE